jgi:hypothetical protein
LVKDYTDWENRLRETRFGEANLHEGKVLFGSPNDPACAGRCSQFRRIGKTSNNFDPEV